MYRNTWVEVNLDAIYDNVKTTKDICKKKYIAVVKANPSLEFLTMDF